MSKLEDKLATSVLDAVEEFPLLKQYRAKISDRKSHIFIGNLESFKASVYQGVKTQRSKGWSPTVKQDEELTQVITEYLSNMHSILKITSKSKIFSHTFIGGKPTDFKVRITGDGVIFDYIKRIRQDANISKVSNTIKKLFDQTGKRTAVDVTHMETSTVAEQFATEIISRFESVGGSIPADTAALEKLKVTIKYNPLSIKVATISVEDGFGLTNQSTTFEEQVSKLLKQALGKNFVQKEAKNILEARINKELNTFLDISQKNGAKTSKRLPVAKGGTSTKTRQLKGKAPKRGSTIVDKPDKINVGSGAKTAQNTDWSSLKAIINSKLPLQVEKNMGFPKLENKTGRFASSAEVVRVDITKGGYPSIVFNYQRDPYDVFDKTKGAPPWNTIERDPKALIDQSIREIVQGMAIGRFYTRRA